MKNKLHNADNSDSADTEIEAAIHATLGEDGRLLPRTAEEVAQLRAKLDKAGVPTPDAHKFQQFMRERISGKTVRLPQAARAVSAEVGENLAIAARNGRKITKQTREKMDVARKDYEKSHPSPSNGSH